MIRCEQLKKKFRRSTVLSNISFQIDEPKIIALIGRNGTGKSTLLRLIAGHLKPTVGKIEVLGHKSIQQFTSRSEYDFYRGASYISFAIYISGHFEAGSDILCELAARISGKIACLCEYLTSVIPRATVNRTTSNI